MHSDILSDCLHCLYRVQDLPCGFVESPVNLCTSQGLKKDLTVEIRL